MGSAAGDPDPAAGGQDVGEGRRLQGHGGRPERHAREGSSPVRPGAPLVAAAVAAAIPEDRHVELEGEDHGTPHAHPEALLPALRDFLA